jgi:hypothetical protein
VARQIRWLTWGTRFLSRTPDSAWSPITRAASMIAHSFTCKAKHNLNPRPFFDKHPRIPILLYSMHYADLALKHPVFTDVAIETARSSCAYLLLVFCSWPYQSIRHDTHQTATKPTHSPHQCMKMEQSSFIFHPQFYSGTDPLVALTILIRNAHLIVTIYGFVHTSLAPAPHLLTRLQLPPLVSITHHIQISHRTCYNSLGMSLPATCLDNRSSVIHTSENGRYVSAFPANVE